MTTTPANADFEKRCADLEGTIAAALAAMDEGLYGDARRILKTGKAAPVTAASSVLAFPGPK